MKTAESVSDVGWVFWLRWVAVTLLGWVVGGIGAIILSDCVVNRVYPKETNLILGLCLGAAVSLAQKLAVRRQITLSYRWVWGATVGIGTPFVAAVLLNELQPGLGDRCWLPLLIAGGAVCGLLQAPALRPLTSRAVWWVLACALAWSLAWLTSRVAGIVGIFGGGALLGAIGGGVLLWLRQSPKAAQAV